MSALPMQAPAGVPWYMIPGASPGGLFGGGFFGGPAVSGNPASAQAPVMGPQGQTIYSGAMPSIPKSAMPTSLMDKLGNGLFGELPSDASGVFGDPQQMRRQQMMAMAAGLMSAPNGASTGQAIGGAYLAANKAGNEYMQDAQRTAYNKALLEQQQMAIQEKQMARQREAARAAAMAQSKGITPEALESSAMTMYQQGDVAGAEAAIAMADNIRQREISLKNANTNAQIAEANLNGGTWLETPTGLFYGKKDGSLERKASWAQFNPNTGGASGAAAAGGANDTETAKAQLGAQISELVQWAENDGGRMFGSPVLGGAFDATAGKFFGTEDAQMRRSMTMLQGNQLLEMAKYLKPMSNSDIDTLKKMMPTDGDDPKVWAKWLRNFAARAQINIDSTSVYDKYKLEAKPEGSW